VSISFFFVFCASSETFAGHSLFRDSLTVHPRLREPQANCLTNYKIVRAHIISGELSSSLPLQPSSFLIFLLHPSLESESTILDRGVSLPTCSPIPQPLGRGSRYALRSLRVSSALLHSATAASARTSLPCLKNCGRHDRFRRYTWRCALRTFVWRTHREACS
jgi:hypothetical protein